MLVRQRARPQLHADAIKAAVTAALAQGKVLDVNSQAKRIAKATGLSQTVTARDLFEAGVGARVPMELVQIACRFGNVRSHHGHHDLSKVCIRVSRAGFSG
jgi:hypothetical protein